MDHTTILHNPRCSKSRATLQLLKEKGADPEVRLYLKDVPTAEELKNILHKLNIKAEELVRKKEKIFKENYRGKQLSEKEWIEILAQNPKLIERPIVIKGEQAVIGRPPERVEPLL